MSLEEDAQAGLFFELHCTGCHHEMVVTAKTLLSYGMRCLASEHDRLSCSKCRRRSIAIRGYGEWTGPADERPADWADTVERRMLEMRPARRIMRGR